MIHTAVQGAMNLKMWSTPGTVVEIQGKTSYQVKEGEG